MQVKLIYSPRQLEEAVNFISEHNRAFIGNNEYVRNSIWRDIVEMVEKFPHLRFVSTMGYTLMADASPESIDEDENELFIDISVDPNIGEDYTSMEQVFDVPRESVESDEQ